MHHQLAIVELPFVPQTRYQVENKVQGIAGRKRIMTSLVQKVRSHSVVANIAEYVVMLFVAVMTGLSTLRLLGMLP
jgi:hypothetical protein